MRFVFGIAAALLSVGTGIRSASAAPAAYSLVEAEANSQGETVILTSASGGKAVSRQGAYQPIVIAPIPSSAGDSFVVWVRYSGSALQLKGIAADGKQTEFNWAWDAPADLKWVSLGRHTRTELGDKVLLMHGPDSAATGVVDALVFAPSDTFDPNTDLGKKPTAKAVVAPTPSADGNYTVAEAESDPKGQVVEDINASGGKYVKNEGAWQPMIVTTLPTKGDAFVIWARYQGVPLQLKSIRTDGKQHDLNWSWDSPSDWKWASFGKHTREELGTSFLLMRGPDAKGTPALDAVVVTTDETFDPNTAFPKLKNLKGDTPHVAASNSSKTDPITASVTVDWTKTIAQTTPLTFGSNDFSVIFPETSAQDPLYAKRIADMGVSFLRVHNGGLTSAWTDPATKTWNEAKIKAAYDAPYLQGKTLVQNIPTWPAWMKDTDGVLNVAEYDAYAQLCADLVRVLNIKQKRHVRYWEPLNEQDQHYAQLGKLDELWVLYNKCAVAMHAVDPTINVGGIPFTWDDPAKVEPFLKACAPNVDFLSWHRYGSGDKNDSNDTIMSYTPAYDTQVAGFRVLTKKYIPNRTVPLILDEYSIDYSWQSGETRQWTNVGAVWFASSLKHMADAGLDMGASWNLKDGFYGIMDAKDLLRPAGIVHQWGNHYLIGAVAKTSSDQPMAEAMAVRQSDGSHSLLLINKAAGVATLNLQFVGQNPLKMLSVMRLDKDGVTLEPSAESALVKKAIVLQPYSLLLLRFP